ncbi:hypothetical protein [Streptomyces sp. NBC_00996]|uniref:hypothetical protein n=1 Tax=Streptomyces sp. NBC_00996 TaxID=2903710 RepID=UPI00386B3446|nr:hypothetical protein OG390_00830 [Streptomyces sp. NBC_00996]
MQSSAQGTRGPTLRSTRPRTAPFRGGPPGARGTLRASAVVALAAVLLISQSSPAVAVTDSSEPQAAGTLPWYLALVSSLAAAGVSAGVTLLTARTSLVHSRRDRRQDRADAETRRIAHHAERELRDRKIANRTAWTAHYQRIDDLLVSVGRIEYEIRRRRLHTADPETADLIQLKKAAEQYATYAPGRLPAALTSLAAGLDAVSAHLLPTLAELNNPTQPRSLHLWHALFAQAGEQARAADHLTRTLKKAQAALRHEWGMD